MNAEQIGIEQFFMRDKANEGIKVPLVLPDGTPTQHWIMIRGVDSDLFRQTEAEEKRKAVDIALENDPHERYCRMRDSRVHLVASLIISWSFDEELNEENIHNLLVQAPQIMDAIDKAAAKRSLFFGTALGN